MDMNNETVATIIGEYVANRFYVSGSAYPAYSRTRLWVQYIPSDVDEDQWLVGVEPLSQEGNIEAFVVFSDGMFRISDIFPDKNDAYVTEYDDSPSSSLISWQLN